MASDLKIEIFAYKWFHKILLNTELLSCKYDVTQVYKDECLADPECNEASDCDHLYRAIQFRILLFEEIYLKEIHRQINEFRHSQTDFYTYILRTCNRVDLFGNLTIFERVFATCAFVCCLCLYCEDGYPEIMRYGGICWAMYFDNVSDEFYKLGGWKRLKIVAVSYKLPIDFAHILKSEEQPYIILIKIRKAIKSYSRFKEIGEMEHSEYISILWVKFYSECMNGSSYNELDESFEEIHFNELKNCPEVENILKQLKYLCDPNGSEVLKSLGRMSTVNSLETSMDNLNIESKETILVLEPVQNTISSNFTLKSSVKDSALTCRELDKAASTSLKTSSKRNSLVKSRNVLKDEHAKSEYFQLKSQEQGMETATVEHLFENKSMSKWNGEKDVRKNTNLTAQLPSTEAKDIYKILCDSEEEQHDRKIIKEANKSTVLNEPMSSAEDKAKKKNNETQNDINYEQYEWEAKGIKRNTSLSERISPTRNNAEKRRDGKAKNDARKEQGKQKSVTQTKIQTEEKDTEMQNCNGIWDAAGNEENECEILKSKKISTTLTTQISFPKRRKRNKRKKENGNENQDETRKENGELKDKIGEKENSILAGQMSSTGKNDEEENKSRNNIRKKQEDGDIRNFLRMLLVLGDKQGISYVSKTSKFYNKEFNS